MCRWVNEVHVPMVKNPDGLNRPVIIYISSKDVVHSFKVIALRVTQDAIPGMRIPIWFRPTQEGRFQINCAQLCGNGHSAMSQGFVVVESQAAYEKVARFKGRSGHQLRMTTPVRRQLQLLISSGLVLLVGILLLTFWVAELRFQAAARKPLPVYGTIADFILTNQSGQVVSLAALQGQVWVADINLQPLPWPLSGHDAPDGKPCSKRCRARVAPGW